MIVGIRQSLLRTTMLVGVVGATYLFARDARAEPPAFAPNFAAVDGVNGKAEALAGSIANRSLYGSQGSFSIPLAGYFGAQLDGGLGSFAHRGFAHIGGHLFWRDPAQGLIGVYTSYTGWNQFGGVHLGNVAAEGEHYFGRFTLQGIAGVEFGNSASRNNSTLVVIPPAAGGGAPGTVATSLFSESYDIKTRFFDQINLKYYVGDNWDVFVGHRYQGGKNALALGTEVGMPISRGVMMTGFAEARIGENQFHGLWGGLRFYFGQKDKPLIARHRQDDPNLWGVSNLFGIINNYTNSGGSSSTTFCDPSNPMQSDGTCGEPG